MRLCDSSKGGWRQGRPGGSTLEFELGPGRKIQDALDILKFEVARRRVAVLGAKTRRSEDAVGARARLPGLRPKPCNDERP